MQKDIATSSESDRSTTEIDTLFDNVFHQRVGHTTKWVTPTTFFIFNHDALHNACINKLLINETLIPPFLAM
jgi:hypothetical protein